MDSICLMSGGVSQTVIRDKSLFRDLKLTFSTKFSTANSSKLLATGEKLKSALWICMPARQITATSEIKYQTPISREWYYFLFSITVCGFSKRKPFKRNYEEGVTSTMHWENPDCFTTGAVQQSTCINMMHLTRKKQDVLEPVSIQHEVMTK